MDPAPPGRSRVICRANPAARAEDVSLVGQVGPLQQVIRAALEAALEAEMAERLDYDRGETPPAGSVNERKR
jgi:transposase-like protein